MNEIALLLTAIIVLIIMNIIIYAYKIKYNIKLKFLKKNKLILNNKNGTISQIILILYRFLQIAFIIILLLYSLVVILNIWTQ